MAKNTESPNYPIARPGVPTLQLMTEALDREERHEDWHEQHPGEFNCPPELCPPGDYQLIEDGRNLMGGMTFEPGDAFKAKGGK